jgi:predicted nucleic acid-binding protein
MYTIDASVWVNSFDQREEGHEISRQMLDRISAAGLPVVVPELLLVELVEIAGAISRKYQDGARAQTFADTLRALPNVTFVPLDEVVSGQAITIADQHALRGADAVYAAVAIRHGCSLISLDQEHRTRLPGIVPVKSPAEIL